MNKDFARGMIVSLALKSLPVRKKAPIAYLYNGVRLPALPEWDRAKYPYVFLTKQMLAGFGGIADYELRVVSKPTYTHASNGNYVVCYEGYYEYFEGEGWKELKQTSGSIHPDYIKWANFDITDENGAVVLEKSTPIPIYNEPTEYLYNGVRLPKLPEWDKEAYPYAVLRYITLSNVEYVVLKVSQDVCRVTGSTGMNMDNGGPGQSYITLRDGGTKWDFYESFEPASMLHGGKSYWIWTSHDIIQESNSSVWLEASEPIPIYE